MTCHTCQLDILCRNIESLYGVMGFPCGSAGKESTYNVGDLGLTPGLGRSSGGGNGYPSQYSGLENSTDCIVHGVHKGLDMTERLSLSRFMN